MLNRPVTETLAWHARTLCKMGSKNDRVVSQQKQPSELKNLAEWAAFEREREIEGFLVVDAPALLIRKKEGREPCAHTRSAAIRKEKNFLCVRNDFYPLGM